MTGRARQGGALVALVLVLGVIASLLGGSAGVQFVSVPAQGHSLAIVRSVVADAAGSVPTLPRLVLPSAGAGRVPAGVSVSSADPQVGLVVPTGLLSVVLVALATLLAPGRRARTVAVMSALPRRAPPGSARSGSARSGSARSDRVPAATIGCF